MKQISPLMETHLGGVLTTLCTCWKITRQDGEILGFTDHDQDLVIDGISYTASSGYYRSAITNSADTGVDNLDVSGFLDDGSLNETELRNGAYDYAQVEVFSVNWANLVNGIIRLRYGFFGEVMIVSSGFFKVELRGLTQLFAQTIGETYSPECRADLGDERCKVPLVPFVRRSLETYQLGQRFIVPQLPGVSLRLPLNNPGFEGHTLNIPGLTNQAGDGVVTNEWRLWQDPFGPENDYRYKVVTGSGIVQYRRAASAIGPLQIPTFALRSLYYQDDLDDIQMRVTMFWADGSGAPLVGVTPVVSDWIDIPQADTTFNSFPETMVAKPVGASYAIWNVEWRNASIGQLVFIPYPSLDNVPIPQASFQPQTTTLSQANEWVAATTNVYYPGPTIWMSPYAGDYCLSMYPSAGNTSRVYQEISVGEDIDGLYELIDSGRLRFKVSAMHGAATVGVANFFAIRYSPLGAFTNGPLTPVHGRGFWGPMEWSTPVPPGTRSLRLYLNTTNTSDNAAAYSVWDNVSIHMYEESYENQDNYLNYGGVEFVCTLAGQTASEVPAYNYAIGAVTVDGTAQFQAQHPTHMFVAEITSVANNKQFTINLPVSKANDWFEWGVLEVLTGLNVKKKMEVARWDDATKTVTLALNLPYKPLVGDYIRMHTGCAKSRAVCNSKFGNIVNYRGEPDLPGTDQYFKIGAANSGGSAPPGK